MTDETELTPRQIAALAALKRAEYLHRIAWGGERTRAYKKLEEANLESVQADIEAGHMALKEDNREGVRR